jgi:hypothetical protein
MFRILLEAVNSLRLYIAIFVLVFVVGIWLWVILDFLMMCIDYWNKKD